MTSQLSALIDTCSLDHLLKNEKELEDFLSIISGHNIVLYIPLDSIMEITEGSRDDLIVKKLGNFSYFSTLMKEDKIFIVRPVYDWLCREIRRTGRLLSPPTTHRSPKNIRMLDVFENQSECLSYLETLSGLREKAFTRKDELLKADRTFKKDAKSKFNDKDLVDYFQKDKIPPLKEYDSYLPVFSKLPSFSRKKIRRIIRGETDSYHYIRTYIHLFILRTLGNAISDFSPYPHLKFLQSLKRGNWSDLGFILMASKLNYLITDDTAVREFNSHLQSRGIVKSEGIRLSEFRSNFEE